MSIIASADRYVLPPAATIAGAPNRDRFWQMIYERQAIYHRRFVEKRPAPWTRDEVLATYHFTNVLRSLDRLTIFYVEQVLPHIAASGNPADVVAGTILFRRFNKDLTWDRCLKPYATADRPWDFAAMYLALVEMDRTGEPVFTGAFTVSGKNVLPHQTKIECIIQEAEGDYRVSADVWKRISWNRSAQIINKDLQRLRGIGPFLAYEIFSDLVYTGLLRVGEDQWANVGPGAKRGLKLLSLPATSDAIKRLRDAQQSEFARLGLSWADIALRDADGNVRWLTMRDVEHSLCEYQKFARGNTRNRFTPNPAPLYRTQAQ